MLYGTDLEAYSGPIVSFLTTNTTTNALTYFVLDLATKPEYIQPLRDEIEQVARQDNVEEDGNGVLRFKRSSLAKLWKLDSFMKESSRLSKGPSKCECSTFPLSSLSLDR